MKRKRQPIGVINITDPQIERGGLPGETSLPVGALGKVREKGTSVVTAKR